MVSAKKEIRENLLMTISLRNYQSSCLESIESYFKKTNRQLIQMPTGAGKTIVFLEHLKNNSNKSIIICPTKDLVEQTLEKSKLFFKDREVFAKTNKYLEESNHYIVTAASLWRDNTLDFFLKQNLDTIILDECHHACSKTYQHFINKLLDKNKQLKILGFTATPERLDKGDLLQTFGRVTFRRNVLDLINDGYLCDVSAYKIKTGQNFSDKVVNGDFSNVALKDLDNESRNNLIVKTYRNNCSSLKTLIFCINIDHAEKLANHMRDIGIKAHAIHGKLTPNQRKNIIERFKKGEIKVLTNCQLLTEGFDEPSIEALIIARPTKSKALYCQMVGRGLRNHPGKELCHVYELADNSHKICTFDVMTFEKKPEVEYPYGVRLTRMKQEIEKITLEIKNLHKEKIDIFKNQIDFSHLHTVEELLSFCSTTRTSPLNSDADIVRFLMSSLKGLIKEIYLHELQIEKLPEFIEKFRPIFLFEKYDPKNPHWRCKERSYGGKISMMDKLHRVAWAFDEMNKKGLKAYNLYKDLLIHFYENYCKPYNIENCFWYLLKGRN